MKSFRKILSTILCILILMSVVTVAPFSVGAADTGVLASGDDSGTTGDCTWTYDSSTGTLTISGTGAMEDYTSTTSVPWYSYRSSISTVVISSGVTSIGTETFEYCDSLTSVTIPNSVTNIGNYAFYFCKSLVSVTIPNSVTSIGNFAFGYCTNLISATISESVTSIGSYAFYGCEGLTSAIIPNSVASMGSSAFERCTNLTNVVIGNGLSVIGMYDFYGCTSLTNIIIGCNVARIGEYAFSLCSNLSNVLIQNTTTTIDQYTFFYCTSLTDVYYSGSEEDWGNISIGSSNTYLTSATIHYDCPNYDYALSDVGTVTVTSANTYKYIAFIPSTSGEYNIYSTGSYDTYGNISNYSGTQLSYNDDSGSGTNFYMTVSLTAGQPYYIGARRYSGTTEVSYDVTVELNDTSETTESTTSTETEDTTADETTEATTERITESTEATTESTEPTTTEPVESTTEEETTEDTEPITEDETVTESTEFTTESTEETTDETTEETTTAKFETYTYYFAPQAADVEAGCTFIVNIKDSNGAYTLYEAFATGKTFRGLDVYAVVITADTNLQIADIQYQVYNAEGKWVSEVEFEQAVDYSYYVDRIMVLGTDMTSSLLFSYDPDETTETETEDTTSDVIYDYYVVGDESLFGVSWTIDAANGMTRGEDGDYYLTIENVPAGTYEFKVQGADQTWHPSGMANNGSVTVDTDGTTVIFRFNEEEDYPIAIADGTIPTYPTEEPTTAPTTSSTSPTTESTQPTTAISGTKEGVTGECKWTLDLSSGVLTISGSGTMDVYGSKEESPWANYVDNIISVVIEKGVTYIGENAFCHCENMTNVTIASSVTWIDDYAFYQCTSLQSITIPGKVTRIGRDAFTNCESLKNIKVLRMGAITIGEKAIGYTYDTVTTDYSKVDSLVISGYKSCNTLQSYAKYNGFTFKSLGAGTTVTLKKSSAKIYIKGKVKISSTVKNGSGKTTYKSSNPKVAKVSTSGKVTGVKKGKATITVTNNGVSKKFKVTVKKPKLNFTKITLKRKTKLSTSRMILSITGQIGKAKLRSTNKKVAKVSGKVVTALKKGKATIIVKTNGIKLKCKVTVK